MKTFFLILVLAHLYLFSNVQQQNGWPPNMTAGFLVYTCNWKLHELVAQMAIVDLKAIGVMPSDLNFKFYSRQSCDDESAMNTSLDLYKNYHVNVFFGPECFAAISITALLAANLDLPTFGYLSVSSQPENKRKYKTLVRTANSMSYMSQAIREVLLYFKWRRIVVIRVPGSTCDVLTDAFPTTFSDTNVNVVSTLMVNYNDTNSMQSTLDQLKLEARIALICGGTTSPDSALPLLTAAYEYGMKYPDYVFFVPEYNTLTSASWEPWLQPWVSASDASYFQKVYKSVFTRGANKTFTALMNTMMNIQGRWDFVICRFRVSHREKSQNFWSVGITVIVFCPTWPLAYLLPLTT